MTLKMPFCSVDKVTQITPSLLHSMGVRAVLLDVDNTLSPPQSQVPFPGTVAWAEKMQREGFRLLILSNNFRSRVEPFAAQYGLPFVSFALKPLPGGYLRAMRQLQAHRSETVVVGDQVYTDVIGANLVGLRSILVTPCILEESASFLRRRRGEEEVRRALKASGRHLTPKE
ncbi:MULTISPECIES: YqeG family HAD IIIA-type phosphatase [Caproicibacterium]|uniref:YqeG family HAD IIIA-type phosphatase n=1 Tax=Caproicibacterium argilliputei TaxID=3030016 RepID=A0AA97D8Q8_9FIRM|nr:YqeG family HAD IIIA-type phosphatase [Caproicibacterium argilliputei]WOC31349.1 YqeG family HAD IIIA-type phosphatase [Caproicibacterium argilliputei]